MSDSEPTSSKPRKPRTRWVYALLMMVIAVGVLGRIYLNPAHYIPVIEAALEEATGLPASVEGITIEPGGLTSIMVSGITLGDADFRIHTDQIEIELIARPLFQRKVRITTLKPGTLECTLPDDDMDAYEKMAALVETLSQPGNDSTWDVSVDLIQVDTLRFLQGEAVAAEIYATLNHILDDTADVQVTAALHRLGPDAAFSGAIQWAPGDDGAIRLLGHGEGTGLDVTALSSADVPEAVVDFQFEFMDSTLDSIMLKLAGTVDAESEPALDGAFSSLWRYTDDTLTVNDIQWDAPGVTLAADLTRTADGFISAKAPVLTISERALDDLIALVDVQGLVLSADADAHLSGTNLALEWVPNEDARVTEGHIVFEGVHTHLETGEPVTHAMKGDLDVRDNVIYIRELKDDDINLSGTVTPDMENETVALDLQGTVSLHRGQLALLGDADAVEEISGLLKLDRIIGTFGAASGVPDDLVITGKLTNGSLVFSPDSEFPPLNKLEAQFITDRQSIQTTISGRTPKSGVAEVKGAYTFADHTWDGTAVFDVHAWVVPFISSEKIRNTYGPMVAEFASPVVRVHAKLPTPGSKLISLGLRIEGTPSLTGTVILDRALDDLWTLGDVTATATLPLDNLDSIVFAEVAGDGVADLWFTHTAVEDRYQLDVDLTSTMLTAGEHIKKRPGDGFTVALTGSSKDFWTLDNLDIDCLGKAIACRFEEGRLHIPQTTMGLASWQRLLPDGATATGYVTGTFDGASKEWALSVDRAGIAINPDLAIDSATGSILIQDGQFICRDLHILSTESDFVLSAGMQDKGWVGSLRGSKIDVNALREFQKAYKEFRYPEDRADSGSGGLPEEASPGDQYWNKPFIGTFDVSLDTLRLGRGSVSNVRARILAESDAVRFSDLRIQPDAGSMTGHAAILPNEVGASNLLLNLKLDQFNAQVLDDMIYEETRGLYGSVSGQVEFEGPLGEFRAMMAAGDGRATFTAVDGSFGKMGFATKLLTALKTVNLINLRLPSLKDKGLTYRTFGGTAVMSDGVLSIQNLLLEETSYAMEMGGTLDYARDTSDFLVFVRVLESVTNLAKKIPGLKQVAEITTKKVGVNVQFSGSPWDMQSNVVGSDGIVGSTVGAGGKAIKSVGDSTKKAVKKILNPKQ